jgi:PAS domain S-box-containing protein
MSIPIDILHLEDDLMDAELVEARLKEANLACKITVVQAREEFEHSLRQNTPDIILADFRLPMFDGLTALQLANQYCPAVPFIFVSGTMGEEAAIKALTQGAVDYLLKNNLSRLVPAVQRALQEARNQRERSQAEEALALSEMKMRSILDSVDESFIVIDRDYRILSANRAFCNLVNRVEGQVLGRRCHDIFFQCYQSGFKQDTDCPARQTFETGKAYSTFHSAKDESGNLHYLERHSYPIIDPSGTTSSVIETIIDVTEKHKLQEQLTQAQKMESIARLAGGVAHDFNNMLSVIMGRSELAMQQLNSSQPLYADLQKIREAAERSAALVGQLLAFARKQPVSPEVLNLNETVAKILKMLRPLIGEAIDLAWKPTKGRLMVRMDSSQIDQILVNLCVNARDAIDSVGKITIATDMVTIYSETCAYHPQFIPGEYTVLSVSDDGRGMDDETMRKIFEPFFTTKGLGRGTGLGLSTVYGIVRQNGGFVDVYSEPEHGTVFKVYLPRYMPEHDQPIQEENTSPTPRGHETILLVEDEQSILAMICQTLEGLGYQVLSASLPSEAIHIAKTYEREVNLLLTDVVMPEMNGWDLAKRVKERYPQIACIFMSGYSDDVFAHHGILEKGIQFLQKPFSIQNLAVKVRHLLDEAPGR